MMADPEYESQSFDVVAQFPSIFEPTVGTFGGRAMYSVVFDHAELPEPARWYVRPSKMNRARANSQYAPALAELTGQENRLQRLLEQAAASRVKHRLLTLQPIRISVQPYVVRHPLASVPVALSLRAVGLYVTNLETRYEQLMEELRDELNNKDSYHD